MTRDKAPKRATRARMAKTGESYTAARRHVLKPKEELDPEVLGQSDANIRRNTGKGWREWLSILDAGGQGRGSTARSLDTSWSSMGCQDGGPSR